MEDIKTAVGWDVEEGGGGDCSQVRNNADSGKGY